MTDHDEIIIQPQLPNHERKAAAAIYYESFQSKMRPLFGNAATAVPLLADAFNPELGLTAFAHGQVVGLAGLHHQHRQFVQLRFADLVRHLGVMSAIWRYGIASLFARAPQAGELLMDGIAVTQAMRGKGVGTRLLEAVVAFGQAHRYHRVRLDVINTNPGAQRLYQRFGFVPTATHTYPFMQLFGFTAVTTMVKSII